jgi:chloramphenicol-sensitive protein RarD
MVRLLHAPTTSAEATRGVFAAFVAYFTWGMVPLYWKLLASVDATELIAHRILWSLVLLLGVQALRGRLRALGEAWRNPKTRRQHLFSGLLLTANWLIYIWGINAGYVIECSLGYFLVPLLNAALGRLVLRERLRPGQKIALSLASAGVALLVFQVGHVPWIALGLASTFGLYGLLRKQATLGPMTGLTLETLLVVPLALGYLGWAAATGRGALGQVDAVTTSLVLSTGIVTAIPLLLFAYGARRLRFTTLGLLQYVAPTCQFLLGWLVYHEPFTADRAWAFALIWGGLACYTWDALRSAGTGRATTTSPAAEAPSRL